jgi:hypothetical protein
VVVIERGFARLLSYKMVFFANEASLHRVAENLRPTELARFFYMTEKLDGSRFVIGRDRNRTVCNDLRHPLEKMWKGLAHCSRTDIRRAESLAARVRITCNEEASRADFLAVFNDFARLKDGVRQISSRILQRYERFTDRLVLYLDGQPMVVNLVLRDPESGRVRGLYSGSRRLDTDDPKKARLVGNLNRMLHWHNMRLYKEEGFDTYDWGGISDDRSEGRVRFKMSFGGAVVEEYTYLCAGWPQLGTIVQPLFDLAYVRVRLKSALKASIERTSRGRLHYRHRITEGNTQIPRQIDRTRDTTDPAKSQLI